MGCPLWNPRSRAQAPATGRWGGPYVGRTGRLAAGSQRAGRRRSAGRAAKGRGAPGRPHPEAGGQWGRRGDSRGDSRRCGLGGGCDRLSPAGVTASHILTVAPEARQHTALPSHLSLWPQRLVLETRPEALFTFPSRASSSSGPLPLQLHSRVQPLLFLGTPCPLGGTFLSFQHICINK